MIFKTDMLARIVEEKHIDRVTGDLTIARKQDVAPIMNDAQGLRNLYDERTPFTGDGFHHVGSIPISVLFGPERDAFRDDPNYALEWLEKNPKFKSRPQKLWRRPSLKGLRKLVGK